MTEGLAREACLVLAPLFEYPGHKYCELAARAASAIPEAAREEMSAFCQGIDGCSLAGLEEAFIRIFDLNPDCALDIGWHLFGEDYARGEFLVKLKAEHRRYGVDERSELPDHLPAVLRLLAAMPDNEAETFVAQFLSPALVKIRTNVKDDESPFAHLLNAAIACLGEIAAIPSNEGAVHE